MSFLAPIDALQIPLKTETAYPNGFPRHGDIGTVDAAGDSIDIGDFRYTARAGDPLRGRARSRRGRTRATSCPAARCSIRSRRTIATMLELYRKNKTIDLAFTEGEVATSAKSELMANGDGRVHFAPK